MKHNTGIGEIAQAKGLNPGLLYEVVVELAREGLVTATALDAAAGIILTELGLPNYFFRNLSRQDLMTFLRSTARTIQATETGYVLRGEVSEVPLDMQGGVQVRLATPENRDRMEKVLDPVMSGHRVEYYCGRDRKYYTYIIHPESVPELKECQAGASPFAFNNIRTGTVIPPETKARYESFLQRASACPLPLIETSQADTGETRIMFLEDFKHSPLPVIRKLLEDLKINLHRAYWETYRGLTGRIQSVCSLYLDGQAPEELLATAIKRLRWLLSLQVEGFSELYVSGKLSFEEYLFIMVASCFLHSFIHKKQSRDLELIAALTRPDLKEIFTRRIFNANRAEYTRTGIIQALKNHPDLVKQVFRLFDKKFNPEKSKHPASRTIEKNLQAYQKKITLVFQDDRTLYDIFIFLTHLITAVRRTNFYKSEKRSFSFWLSPEILDPAVFTEKVYSIFFVVGFYATGTHMRAAEIARGGVRLSRVTVSSHENVLDEMPLLNYALGPVAQRLKHKDVAEDGAKGVIVPDPEYAGDSQQVFFDYLEGILDLIQEDAQVVDYLGKKELVFFGPDEGTADFMDLAACRARERNYPYWRTISSGKSNGIPHDAYGLTGEGKLFGLHPCGSSGTCLEIEGETVAVTPQADKILKHLSLPVATSGMTTTGILSCLRTIEQHLGLKEEELVLMMTGGPDGDLGANQILSFRGRICLVVDSGAVLFDACGLDREELAKLAVARHTRPRLNTLAYPEKKLSRFGFKIPRQSGSFSLQESRLIEDGIFFHRSCLTDTSLRPFFQKAGINVFIPCGGFKDTINVENVSSFLSLFPELLIIVEGANVFFDEPSREVIAKKTRILQIRDSSANKGGVTSSSLAEVLPAFLLGDDYEKIFTEDKTIRCSFIKEILRIIQQNCRTETEVLLSLHQKTGLPLPYLSCQTSRWLLALQDHLYRNMEILLSDEELVDRILLAYIPRVLVQIVSLERIKKIFSSPDLVTYRNALITKKLASLSLYSQATRWEEFLQQLKTDFLGTLKALL